MGPIGQNQARRRVRQVAAPGAKLLSTIAGLFLYGSSAHSPGTNVHRYTHKVALLNSAN